LKRRSRPSRPRKKRKKEKLSEVKPRRNQGREETPAEAEGGSTGGRDRGEGLPGREPEDPETIGRIVRGKGEEGSPVLLPGQLRERRRSLVQRGRRSQLALRQEERIAGFLVNLTIPLLPGAVAVGGLKVLVGKGRYPTLPTRGGV